MLKQGKVNFANKTPRRKAKPHEYFRGTQRICPNVTTSVASQYPLLLTKNQI